MKLLPFVLGVGVGYVLGAKAGRERYEQLSRAYRRVADNPQVQAAAGVAQAKAGEAVHAAVNVAKERVAPASGPAGGQPAAPGRSAGNGTGR